MARGVKERVATQRRADQAVIAAIAGQGLVLAVGGDGVAAAAAQGG